MGGSSAMCTSRSARRTPITTGWPRRPSPPTRRSSARTSGGPGTRPCCGSSRSSPGSSGTSTGPGRTPSRTSSSADRPAGQAAPAGPPPGWVTRLRRGRVSLGRDLAIAAQQGAHLGLSKPPVPAGRADAGDSSRRRPPRDGLRVHPEQGGYLPRGEQPLIVAVHVPSPRTRSEYAHSLATNGYFLPRFLEISLAIPQSLWVTCEVLVARRGTMRVPGLD